MDEIEQKGEGYYIEDIKINSIFYADDALILNNDMQDVRKNLKVLKETSLKYALEINTEKSKMIVFNKKEKVDEIYNIKEVDQLNYLGIIIDNKRNIFHRYKLSILEKAKRLENQTYGIIEKSCNRLLIGKTFWKVVALPAILYATNVITINQDEIEKLQVIENGVYRKILRAASYTPIGALRGEIGSSSMKSRIIKGKIMYYKSIIERENELLHELIEKPNCNLVKEVKKNLEIVNINDIKNKYKKWIEEKIRI